MSLKASSPGSLCTIHGSVRSCQSILEGDRVRWAHVVFGRAAMLSLCLGRFGCLEIKTP